jgi:hypothetical protein
MYRVGLSALCSIASGALGCGSDPMTISVTESLVAADGTTTLLGHSCQDLTDGQRSAGGVGGATPSYALSMTAHEDGVRLVAEAPVDRVERFYSRDSLEAHTTEQLDLDLDRGQRARFLVRGGKPCETPSEL